VLQRGRGSLKALLNLLHGTLHALPQRFAGDMKRSHQIPPRLTERFNSTFRKLIIS